MNSTSAAAFAPNLVAIVRIGLAFVTIAFFALPHPWPALAVLLTIITISMDSLDGFLARRLGVASELGALIDITADRIVEHVFWIYFAVAGAVGVWVPLVVVTRSFLVDTVRSVAFAQGKTPFGEDTMMRSPITRFLVASRFSRSVYGFGKVAVFVFVGIEIAIRAAEAAGAWAPPADWARTFHVAVQALVVFVVAVNLVRGLPVLWDSREYLLAKTYPKQMKDEN